jgi:hypothetical protein
MLILERVAVNVWNRNPSACLFILVFYFHPFIFFVFVSFCFILLPVFSLFPPLLFPFLVLYSSVQSVQLILKYDGPYDGY